MIRYVTKRERKVAKARALKIVRDLQEYLLPEYKIDPKLVGHEDIMLLFVMKKASMIWTTNLY